MRVYDPTVRQLNMFGGDEPYQRPASQANEQIRSNGGGRSPQQIKLQANRDRIAMSPAAQARNFIPEGTPDTVHSQPVREYGMQFSGAFADQIKLSPHDDATFRRFGHYAEMPIQGLRTAQSHVSPDRVREIAADPTIGVDPRFPGSERPLVADVGLRRNGTMSYEPVLHNGNHRVAARASNGEMFAPVTHIDRSSLGAAVGDSRGREEFHADSRQHRDYLAFLRSLAGDPTFRA